MRWYFFLLAEVDEFAFDAVAGGPPLVFVDENAPVRPEIQVLLVQLVDFGHQRLHNGR